MSITQTIKTLVIEALWPWIKSAVWPFIKEYLKDLIIFLASEIRDQIKRHAKKKMDERVKEAESKAQAAEDAAKSSTNTGNMEKQDLLAKVWREVAESLRKDNEELQAKIDEITSNAKNTAIQKLDSEQISLEFKEDSVHAKIGESERLLPPPSI